MTNKSEQKISLLKLITFALTVLILSSFHSSSNAASIESKRNSIQQQIERDRAKIFELKLREKKEVNKLYDKQIKLEQTETKLANSKEALHNTKQKLNNLQGDLISAKSEYSQTEYQVGQRLKQIYKGERISLLNLILASNNISTLLDRIYYQKRLANIDKRILSDMRANAQRLAAIAQNIEYQKNSLANTVVSIQRQEQNIKSSISSTQYMINKLRTDRATYEQAEKELAKESDRLATMIESGERTSKNNFETVTSFLKPISGGISSPFGWRRHPIFGSRSFHSGVDIAGANHGAIRASNSGKVIYSGWYGGYGKVVIINHGKFKGSPTSTLYAHLSRSAVSVGQHVKKGAIVGYEGSTGYSTGPHLHFEIRKNGRPTNPLSYIH